ncbi:MAG: c-type cytochrome [Pseudomonadales bacterium]
MKGRRGALGLGLALAGALAASLSGCDGGAASGDRAAPRPLPPEPLASSYRRHCQQCHSLGVAGAPAVGDVVAWAPRQAQGLPALVARVEAGIPPAMPPRGGCLRCDDATLEALVRWMAFEALETGANAPTEG